MFSMSIQLLNTTAQAFTTSESKQTVQKNAVYMSRGDAAKGEGVLEIPDRATNAENSGKPIRNTAKTSTTAHFESRSLMATPSTILTARSQVKHERSLAKIQFLCCIKYTALHERTVTRAFINNLGCSWNNHCRSQQSLGDRRVSSHECANSVTVCALSYRSVH